LFQITYTDSALHSQPSSK